jgi:ABC-type glycerol-3-phosphate transport system substrate-binding protein
MKKITVFSFTCILLLFSCSKKSNTPASNESPLIFLHYWSDEMDGGVDSMVHSFNAQKTGFKIKATGFDHESFKISLRVMLAGGNPPDIASYWVGAKTNSLVKKDYLTDLDSIWKHEDMDSKFPKAIIDAVTYKGKKYIIPVTQHYVAFFYNRTIFDSLGLTTPTTWSEFKTLCNNISQNDINPIALGSEKLWPAQFWFDYLLLRSAGAEYRQKLMDGKVAYNDPKVVKVFKQWKELLDLGYFNNNPEELDWSMAAKLVSDKKSAMTLMGTWITGYYDFKLKLEQEREYDYFTFPLMDSSIAPVALGPIDGIILPQQSDLNRAKGVLPIFVNKDIQAAMSSGSGALSPSLEVEVDENSPVQKRIQSEIQMVPNWAFNYDLATPPEMAELGLAMFGKFLKTPSQYEELLDELEKERLALPDTIWE